MADLAAQLGEALVTFAKIPMSKINSHESNCCELAKESLLEGLVAATSVGEALSRIPDRLPWGFTDWPVSWCELEDHGNGDCGVHADLASHVLARFGVPHRRCKAVIASPPSVVAHWHNYWLSHDNEARWILPPDLVYHEVLGLDDRWWDPTELCWIERIGDSVSAGVVISVAEQGGNWQFAAEGLCMDDYGDSPTVQETNGQY